MMRKIAVTLDQLRKANKALGSRHVRRVLRVGKDYRPTTKGLDAYGSKTMALGPSGIAPDHGSKDLAGKVYLKGSSSRILPKLISNDVRANKGVLEDFPVGTAEGDHLRSQIRKVEHASKEIRKLSPRGKEAFNRSVLEHEKAETHPSTIGRMSFIGHRGVGPVMRDLNIAATLKGPGSDAAGAIKALRAPEIGELNKLVPGLNAGEGRLSRHAIRRIDKILTRKSFESFLGF
jgi:hypothetical protein